MKRDSTPPHHKVKIGDWIAYDQAYDFGFAKKSDHGMVRVVDEARSEEEQDSPDWANFTVMFRVNDELRTVKYAETEPGAWTKAQRIAENNK